MANFTHGSDTLRSLNQQIQRTLLLTGKPSSRQHLNAPTDFDCITHIPSLDLPLPEDVDHAFDGFTTSSNALNELNHKYRQTILQIQQLHRQKFEQSCRDLCRMPQDNNTQSLPFVMEGLRRVYESRYMNRFLPMIKNQIMEFRSKYAFSAESKKIPFNVEFTPLLERYFEVNAYPSAPDRQVLAQKTAMSPRQIEVWFQNHRKRAKESGKTVNRMQPGYMLRGLIPTLDKRITGPTVAEASSLPEILVRNSTDSHANEANSFRMIAEIDPATASRIFPNRFTSSSALYHLHTDITYTFPPSVWPRKPSSQLTPRSDINFDDFVVTFASKLNIRDGTSRNKRKSFSHSHTQNSWFFATTTIPCRAPHPAFIRPLAAPLFQQIKSSSSNTPLTQHLPISPLPTLLVPSVERPQSRKKASPFPKRRPSKYHPYSYILVPTLNHSRKVHSVESTSFGSSEFAMNSMLPRAGTVTDSTAPHISWVAILESTPPSVNKAAIVEPAPISQDIAPYNTHPASSRPPSVKSMRSSPSRVTSMESTTSGSRATSFGSDSSFGNRTSSLSSIDSSPPATPILQHAVDALLDHQDLQFLDEMSDFDQLLTMGNTQLSFNDDLFAPKADGMFSYALPYFQSTLASCSMNFMQTLL